MFSACLSQCRAVRDEELELVVPLPSGRSQSKSAVSEGISKAIVPLTTQSLKPVRKLDTFEREWDSLHLTGGLMIMNTVVVKSPHPVDSADVTIAARLMMRRHQTLRMRIRTLRESSTGRDHRHWFEMDNAEQQVIVRESALKSADWREALSEEQREQLVPEDGPLWKLRICRSDLDEESVAAGKPFYRTALTASFHHSIMDGVSRQEFWVEILKYLEAASSARVRVFGPPAGSANGPKVESIPEGAPLITSPALSSSPSEAESFPSPLTERTCSVASVATNVPSNHRDVIVAAAVTSKFGEKARAPTKLPDAIQSYLPFCLTHRLVNQASYIPWAGYSLTQFFRKVLNKHKNPFQLQFPHEQFGEQEPDNATDEQRIVTRLLPMWFDKAATAQILAACKARGVTVNGLATAVSAYAMAAVVEEYRQQHPDTWQQAIGAVADLVSCANNHADTASEIALDAPLPANGEATAPAPRARRPSTVLGYQFHTFQAISCRRWSPEYTAMEKADKAKAAAAKAKALAPPANDAAKEAFEAVDMSVPNDSAPPCPPHMTARPPAAGFLRLPSVVGRSSSPKSAGAASAEPFSPLSPGQQLFNRAPNAPSRPAYMSLPPSTPTPRLAVTPASPAKALSRPAAAQAAAASGSEQQVRPGLGSYAALMPVGIAVPQDPQDLQAMWKSAASIAESVHKRVDSPDPTAATWDWQVVTSFVDEISTTRQLGQLDEIAGAKFRPSCFLMSNTGVWRADPNSAKKDAPPAPPSAGNPLELEQSWSCVAQHKSGNSLFAHNMVTLGGRLCWSLQYHPNLTAQPLVDRYAHFIQTLVKDAINMPAPEKPAAPQAH